MSDELKIGLCDACKELRPVAWTDSVGREYCIGCFATLPVPTANRLLEFLMRTVPFSVGDRVECRTAGALYDGVGTIDQISVEPENYGTPVYPSFHVVIDEKAYPEAPDDLWYMETQLTKVDA